MIVCPKCKGSRQITEIDLSSRESCGQVTRLCDLCLGTGFWHDPQLENIEKAIDNLAAAVREFAELYRSART